jgi:hypothetical protein
MSVKKQPKWLEQPAAESKGPLLAKAGRGYFFGAEGKKAGVILAKTG